MTKQRQLMIRKNKFHIRNDVRHSFSYVMGRWWLWLVAQMRFPRRHARPIAPRSSQIDGTTNLAFTCSLVALHAHLAKFKGSLSADAFLEFRCLFPVGDAESQNLRTLFKLAWEDDESLESHIQRMLRCYPGRADLYARALEGLARHMLADGKPSKPQLHWLNHAAAAFGISRLHMHHIIQQAQLPLEARPHALLNLPKRANQSQIKQAYRNFMQRCHPDLSAHTTLPETRMASEKLSRAGNVAYRKLRK